MDESLSWRAELAQSNINILNLVWNEDNTVVEIFYEFTYHPKPGVFKWCKTWTQTAGQVVDDEEGNSVQREVCGRDIADELKRMTLSLRKELEG